MTDANDPAASVPPLPPSTASLTPLTPPPPPPSAAPPSRATTDPAAAAAAPSQSRRGHGAPPALLTAAMAQPQPPSSGRGGGGGLMRVIRGEALEEGQEQSEVEMARKGSSKAHPPPSSASALQSIHPLRSMAAADPAKPAPLDPSSFEAHARPGDRTLTSHRGTTAFPTFTTPPSSSHSLHPSSSPSSSSPPSYAATSNAVISSKYTLLTFLPLNLFEQFHNVANLYFLFVGVLQAIPPISTTNGIPTMYEPLAFIVSISCLRAAKEDYDKHSSDNKRNGMLFDTLRPHGMTAVRSGDLRVGDVIRVKQGDMIPADCLFLASSHAKGHCFLDKANLNGETRLEVMNSARMTRGCREEEEMREAAIDLTYEQPNKTFDSFRGYLRCRQRSGEVREGAVDGKVLLMRETILRNTDFIYGLIVYTGDDTKIQRSTLDGERAKLKVSRIMRTVDSLLKAMLALQVSLCLLGGVLAGVYHVQLRSAWYLDEASDYSTTLTGVLAFFTWFILLGSMVPISLIVSSELVKFTQSVFIQWDVRLYSTALNKAAKVNSSSIHEDLGLIDFIFSDKTGTLTQNKMEFRYAMLGGRGSGGADDRGGPASISEYGSKETDIAKSVKVRQRELAERQGRAKQPQQSQQPQERARPKRERSWVELERVHYARRNERDEGRGCCDRFFPGLLRACWYSQQQPHGNEEEEERILPEDADATERRRQRVQTLSRVGARGGGGGKLSSKVAVSPRDVSAQTLPSALAQKAVRLPIITGRTLVAHSSTTPPPSFTINQPSASSSSPLPPPPTSPSASTSSSFPSPFPTSLVPPLPPPPPPPLPPAPSLGNTFTDVERDQLLSALWGPHSNAAERAQLYAFLQHMALSNTVKPYEEGGELRFQAESAEELAMVHFARRMGFTKRSINPTVLEVDCYEAHDERRERKVVRVEVYNHVATFGFTSKRARVTVIYQRITSKEGREKGGGGGGAGDWREGEEEVTAERVEAGKETLPDGQPQQLNSPTSAVSRFSPSSADAGLSSPTAAEVNPLRLTPPQDDDAADTASTPIHPPHPHSPSLPTPQSASTAEQTVSSASPPTSTTPFASSDASPIVVMSKGQDTVILPFLSLDSIDEPSLLLSLKDMSTNGLRTLVCGHSSLPLTWWTSRAERYAQAIGRDQSEASVGHPEKCRKAEGGCEKCDQHQLFEELEQAAGMSYLGVLGLEDQLQPLVPECISDCLKAGIKVWMITGDKLETAKNIGLACNLIDADMMPAVTSSSTLQSLIDEVSNGRLLEITGQWADLSRNEEDIARLFDSLDTDANGIIDYDELIVVLKTLRCAVGESKLRRLSRGTRGISRAAFLDLMRTTHLTQFDAVKYDVESAIRQYNAITDHSLYPVSILVDRTAFQVMFPSPPKRKDKRKAAAAANDRRTARLHVRTEDVGESPPPSTASSEDGNPSSSTLPSPSSSLPPPPTSPSPSPSPDELELLRAKFFELARRSKSVVFARAEPAMKKRMVTEIQARVKDVITLAIGDGANDCLAVDTPVMMADGQRKPALLVQRGDRLLSSAGVAVTVVTQPTVTLAGATMYRVTDETGGSFVVSKGHLVTLAWQRGPTVTCEDAIDALHHRRLLVKWWRADTLTKQSRAFTVRIEGDDPSTCRAAAARVFRTVKEAEQWGWDWFHLRSASDAVVVDEEGDESLPGPRPLEVGDLIDVRADQLANAKLFQQLCQPVQGETTPRACLQLVSPPSTDAAFTDSCRTRRVVSVTLEPAVTSCVEWQVSGDGRFVLGCGVLTHNCDMIQAAHIGVGIAGVEGTAATNSADYAIGSFRMLHTLLFVHGYWSYQRQSKLVVFIFYKASLVALSMFLFGAFSAFSGQQFFDDPNYEIYNVIYTAVPILALAVFDQPLPAETLQNHPIIYRRTKHTAFTPTIFFTWIGRAFLHAAIVFFFPYAQVGHSDVNFDDGRTGGLWFLSMLVYISVVLTPTLLVLFEMTSLTLLHFASVAGSVASLLLISFIINSSLIFPIDPNLNNVVDEIYASPTSYLLLLLTVAFPLLLELLYRGWQREQRPTITQIFQERSKRLGPTHLLHADSERADAPQHHHHRMDGGSMVHVPIELEGKSLGTPFLGGEDDGNEGGGEGVDGAGAGGGGGVGGVGGAALSMDGRMEAVKSQLVKAMLRMRNQMGGQFDSAAQAGLQLHDSCEVDSVTERRGGGGRTARSRLAGGGAEKSVSTAAGSRRVAPARSHSHQLQVKAEISGAQQSRVSESEDELPWQVPSDTSTVLARESKSSL